MSRWTILGSGLAATAAFAAVVVPGPGAAQAAPSSAFTVTIGYDGTGQGTPAGCPITGPGGDNTAHDSVACTNDDVEYRWSYAIPDGAAVVATLSQTLRPGVTWDATDPQLCAGGGSSGFTGIGSLSPSKRTLTCTLTWPAGSSRSGALPMIAHVDTSVPNATVLITSLTANVNGITTASTAPPITVRSRPSVDLRTTLRRVGTAPNGDTVLLVGVVGIQSDGPSGKGAAALASPLTFVDDLTAMPAGTTLVSTSCFVAPFPGDPQPLPGGEGTWTCAQSAPGQPISIRIDNADTRGLGTNGPGDGAVVFAGAFQVQVPDGTTSALNQLRAFDPVDATGQSNFGAGWEFGGAPADTCADPTNNNCAFVQVIVPGVDDKMIQDQYEANLPSDGRHGYWTVQPGQHITDTLVASVNGTRRNLIACDFWDPAQQRLDTSMPIGYFATVQISNVIEQVRPANVRVQYTTRTFADDSARSLAQCGVPTDDTTDGPWTDTVPDADLITGYRVIVPLVTGDEFYVHSPMINVTTQGGTLVRDYASFRSDGLENTRSEDQYVVTENRIGAAKVALDAQGTVIDSARAGDRVEFRISPTFGSASAAAATLTVDDTLPACEIDPTLDPAAAADWTMTVTSPADVGSDHIACTADDVHGTSLRFVSRSAVAPGSVPPIRYAVTISPYVLDQVVLTNVAVVSAPGNAQEQWARTAAASLTIRALSEVRMAKDVDAPVVEPNPDRIGYTLTWSNTSSSDVGRTQWIDVLPFNGDGRGTAFHGSVGPSSVDVLGSASGITLEYTMRDAGSVNADPNDPSNWAPGGTVWCTAAHFGDPGCPASLAHATAVRITIDNLSVGRIGGLHIVEQPVGNHEGDQYANNVGKGRAANLELAVPTSNTVSVAVVASSFGHRVWRDDDRDGVQDPAEPGLGGVTVRWTGTVDGTAVSGEAVTDSNGDYLVPNLHSGTYNAVVDATSLPAELEATYDLDDQLVSPDSDSGTFSLGYDTDRTDVNFGYAKAPVPPAVSGDAGSRDEHLAWTGSAIQLLLVLGGLLAGIGALLLLGGTRPRRG